MDNFHCSFLLFVAAMLGLSSAYPSGAPTSTCLSMNPGDSNSHAPNRANGPSPFTITVQGGNTYTPGQTKQVTIGSCGQTGNTPFKGFILQARLTGSTTIVGSFSVNSPSLTLLNCPGGTNNAVTHTSATRKQCETVSWTPPSIDVGGVHFVATFLLDKKEYNLGVTSGLVSFAAGSGGGATSPGGASSSTTPVSPSSSTTARIWPKSTRGNNKEDSSSKDDSSKHDSSEDSSESSNKSS